MKILLLDTNHSLISEQLSTQGFELTEDFHSSYKQVLEKIKDFEGIIIRSRIPIDRQFLEEATHLKFIARVGAGMENIDVEFARKCGIILINSPEGNRDAVAEQVIGMLLVLMQRLFISAFEVKNGIWKREENRGDELSGKTVGLIGYGNMGKEVAKRFSGFGCNVIFYDILPDIGDEHATQVTLEELKTQADIVSLHVPITALTHHLINQDFIEGMAKPFYLVNTARGKNINTEHLIAGLESGKILGAALDVLEFEKASFENLEANNPALDFLLTSEKVLVTPHIAGWTTQSKYKLAQVIVDKILAAFPAS